QRRDIGVVAHTDAISIATQADRAGQAGARAAQQYVQRSGAWAKRMGAAVEREAGPQLDDQLAGHDAARHDWGGAGTQWPEQEQQSEDQCKMEVFHRSPRRWDE